ncbi:hypothetical protein [Desulfuribacillus alkaliarsenatis]|uniref:Uncharacterized protein n=1 Tax=Desulfuribacillus alkaliarsenatis TaxID=766136 RepID=A0A1E5G2A2_9FIRM|nr:hypothetical protein [Desulfuribacillus alkaliarsenatis]OEF97037.1 hypothetical protein BHF68_05410 [Desulfuribacillus alkaliarsenatis]
MQPVYTPISFLKRFLIGQEQKLTVAELKEQLKDFDSYFQSAYNMGLEDLVDTTIDQEDSPFIIDASSTILLQEFPIKMNNLAYDYLVQVGKPLTKDKIIKQLSKRTKTPYNQVEKQLNLEKDMRFVEVYGCDRWLLTEWEICNDQVYNLLRGRDSKETNSTHVYQLISTRIQSKEGPRNIWLPEMDERFTICENGKVFIEELDGEVTCMRDNNIEKLDATGNEVHKKIIEQLEQGLYILKKRNERMSEEVVQFFNNNNLDAIHKLMEEKKANKELQHDVNKLIEKWKV